MQISGVGNQAVFLVSMLQHRKWPVSFFECRARITECLFTLGWCETPSDICRVSANREWAA